MSATPAAPALRRDPANGVVAGVCAGVGARLGIDPVLLRVGLVLLTVATAGFALIAYVRRLDRDPGRRRAGAGAQRPARDPAAAGTPRRLAGRRRASAC